eukprot:TRINITY_DN15769_c0_g1_i1.p1 TRINITY_DN15769_c0_g1~~TRINITY_DN15769_c0_g1_i1.p1  ORF type:complete len:137 (+),score=18.96 TRINITY_DN15769_c0_g1_i1:43-411(+)
MIELLWKLDAKNSEGIFRLAGRVSHVTQLREALKHGEEDELIEKMGPDVPADVLKQWMRSLSIPLIPIADYMTCIQSAKKEPNEVKELVRDLCLEDHWKTIEYFMEFLKELISHQENTKMGR